MPMNDRDRALERMREARRKREVKAALEDVRRELNAIIDVGPGATVEDVRMAADIIRALKNEEESK